MRIVLCARSMKAGSITSGGAESCSCTVAEGASRLAAALARDPRVDALFQHVERHRPARQHLIVKRADVELRAQHARRLLAQIEQPQLPDLVPERLPRPGHVTVGLALH